jgi:glyoxylase-like metal-dependent hydrolase (beta-lactamase superfamily II)
MKIKQFQFNDISVNTYIVWDSQTLDAVIIDPGCYYPQEEQTLKQFVEDNKLNINHILNTHLHFDHIFGNNFAEETFGVAAKAHNADMPWLLQIGKRLASFGIQYNKSVNPIKPENFLQEGDVIRFGRHTFQILHIPGHSPGSLVYYCKEENTLFCGDVLFKGSLGRYDFADSNGTALVQGIRQKLFTLPDNTIVYSGHGPSTTIGTEKVYNIIHSL